MTKTGGPAHSEQLTNEQAEDMVREHIGWMLAVAQRLLTDRALAEDAVQDAFLAAFRGFGKFEQRSSVKTWLHRITVNAALMKLRREQRQPQASDIEELPEFDQYGCRREPLWSSMRSTEAIIESKQLNARVREQILSLPQNYRNVLLLRDIEGYSTIEVAALLGLSASNVKVRLHRARSALKSRLEPMLRDEDKQ